MCILVHTPVVNPKVDLTLTVQTDGPLTLEELQLLFGLSINPVVKRVLFVKHSSVRCCEKNKDIWAVARSEKQTTPTESNSP